MQPHGVLAGTCWGYGTVHIVCDELMDHDLHNPSRAPFSGNMDSMQTLIHLPRLGFSNSDSCQYMGASMLLVALKTLGKASWSCLSFGHGPAIILL